MDEHELNELLEQEIKEYKLVILAIDSILNPSEEEKRLKELAQGKLEELKRELEEAKNFFKPIPSDIQQQIEMEFII